MLTVDAQLSSKAKLLTWVLEKVCASSLQTKGHCHGQKKYVEILQLKELKNQFRNNVYNLILK